MDEATFGEVRDAVRRFVREKVLPREDEIEESDAIPADLRAATADLGLFGYALPDEFGGSGVSMAQDVRLAFEFGYADPRVPVHVRHEQRHRRAGHRQVRVGRAEEGVPAARWPPGTWSPRSR